MDMGATSTRFNGASTPCARSNSMPHQSRHERRRPRQPALLAPVPRPDVAGRRAQQRHRAAGRRAATRRCARSASSCSPTAPGPRPTSSNSSAWRSAPRAASATRSTRARREAALEGLFGRRAADRARLDGRRRQIAQGRGQAAAQPRACSPAMRWCAAAGSMSAPRAATSGIELVDPRRRAAHPARSRAARDAGRRRGDGAVEPRAAGAWLAHSLAAEAGGSIQLSRPADEVLMIGVALPVTATGLTPR